MSQVVQRIQREKLVDTETILSYLEDQKDAKSPTEIAEHFGASIRSVVRSLIWLRKKGLVEERHSTREQITVSGTKRIPVRYSYKYSAKNK